MSNPKGVQNTFRRTWDKEEYAKKARERAIAEREADLAASKGISSSHQRDRRQHIVRAPLQARETKVELEHTIGKTAVVSDITPLDARGGYYCKTCECLLKDSISYLDHINGRKHQRALGMSMRTERSNVSQVRARLQRAKERKAGELAKTQVRDKESLLPKRVKKKNPSHLSYSERKALREKQAQEVEQAKSTGKRQAPEISSFVDVKSEDDRKGVKRRRDDDGSEVISKIKTEEKEEVKEIKSEELDPEMQMMMAMGLPVDFSTSKK